MGGHQPRREQRRHVRSSVSGVTVTVRDQHRRTCEAAVINLSAGGLALALAALPASPSLEIRLPNSPAWVKVRVKNATVASGGYIVGCAFHLPPSPEILKALAGSSPRHLSA